MIILLTQIITMSLFNISIICSLSLITYYLYNLNKKINIIYEFNNTIKNNYDDKIDDLSIKINYLTIITDKTNFNKSFREISRKDLINLNKDLYNRCLGYDFIY